MSFKTKLDLNNNKFQQQSGETLTLSGNTEFANVIYQSDVASSSSNPRTLADLGYVTGKTEEINTIKLTKTLTNDKTWVGNASNEAEETDVVTEWVTTLNATGQKINQEVQSVMKTDPATDLIHKTFHLVKNIDLTLTGTTQVLNSYGGKRFIPYSAKMIITSYNIGSGSIEPSINIGNDVDYDNILTSTTLTTPTLNEVFELNLVNNANIDVSLNKTYLNVNTASDYTTLVGMLILEGVIF